MSDDNKIRKGATYYVGLENGFHTARTTPNSFKKTIAILPAKDILDMKFTTIEEYANANKDKREWQAITPDSMLVIYEATDNQGTVEYKRVYNRKAEPGSSGSSQLGSAENNADPMLMAMQMDEILDKKIEAIKKVYEAQAQKDAERIKVLEEELRTMPSSSAEADRISQLWDKDREATAQRENGYQQRITDLEGKLDELRQELVDSEVDYNTLQKEYEAYKEKVKEERERDERFNTQLAGLRKENEELKEKDSWLKEVIMSSIQGDPQGMRPITTVIGQGLGWLLSKLQGKSGDTGLNGAMPPMHPEALEQMMQTYRAQAGVPPGPAPVPRPAPQPFNPEEENMDLGGDDTP